MNKPLIVLDADFVIFDYRHAYSMAWKALHGEELTLVDPRLYNCSKAYGIEWESSEAEEAFRSSFGEDIWLSMLLMPDAKEALERLVSAGYELVIVSAMNPTFAHARKKCCERLGLPINKVFATGKAPEGINPKKTLLNELRPVAFVDDLLVNFKDIQPTIHRALIDHQWLDCKNKSSTVEYHSTHSSLLEFANFWTEASSATRHETVSACR